MKYTRFTDQSTIYNFKRLYGIYQLIFLSYKTINYIMIYFLNHISTVNKNYAIKHHYKCNHIYLFIVLQIFAIFTSTLSHSII